VKHEWKRDSSGEIDEFAFEYDDPESFGGHNGPRCERCGRIICQHCVPNYDDEECSGDKAIGSDLMTWAFATREDWVDGQG
jgi:hypothetical protein